MKRLRVHGLTKSFVTGTDWLGRPATSTRVVDDVNFEIAGGETLALVGESGSGKSTIARLLLGLAKPDAGTIALDGESIVGLGGARLRALRRRMQMVFQDPYASLDPTQRIRDIVGEPLRVRDGHAPGEQRLRDLLADVRLPARFLDRLPAELSGGQRQRVAIARALAVAPEFVACDEVVSALDVSTRAQILELLGTLQRERHLAMLFITHDLSIVPHVAARVAVIFHGRIVESGPVGEVFDQPAHPYTAALLAAVPNPDPRSSRRSWATAPGAVGAIDDDAPRSGCAYAMRCDRASVRCAGEIPVLRPAGRRAWACHHAVGEAGG